MRAILVLAFVLTGCASEIPPEVGLLVQAQSEVTANSVKQWERYLELSTAERKALQDKLVANAQLLKWVQASVNGAVPLAALGPIEEWAVQERQKGEEEVRQMKENWSAKADVARAQKINEVIQDWLRARNAGAGRWAEILAAIRGVTPDE